MFDFSTLLFFIGTSVILIIIPGPDLVFTITQGLANGKRAGVTTALGLSIGNIVHTAAAALGLSLIVKTSVILFTIIKSLGAIYLLYLAYKSIKYRKKGIDLNGIDNKRERLFQKGILMNILNPKVAIFFLTFLPQFVDYEKSNVTLQMLCLGFIFIIMTAILFGLLGYFSGIFRDALLRSPRNLVIMNILAGLIFICLALKLMTIRL
ncbi:LysE family translocator [Paenibacillus turpanensis]|uniref:LysE family translocator n=1 Tax=Paenibacillus turpanensis TaxID=2689078 RepID=UPI0014090108|nr:LysE family translocator [Paenibacillus turpanensis]